MPKSEPNIYQMARNDSPIPLTQESAAEMLFVSVQTVKAWEQGARVPDAKVVYAMSQIYDAPWLCLAHAQTMLRDLGIFRERVQLQGLPTAVLSLDDSIREMLDAYRRLIHIAADGRIDDSEAADFDEIKATILRLVVAGLQVIYHYEHGAKKRPSRCGNTETVMLGSDQCRSKHTDSIPRGTLLCNPLTDFDGGFLR